MRHRATGSIVVLMAAAMILPGCGGSSGGPKTPPAYEIHSNAGFSKDQLNAPLDAAAKAQGAQVAGPPTR